MPRRPFRDEPIRRKLLLAILFTSTVILLLASLAFLAYDVITYRAATIRDLEVLAEVIGDNSTAALGFNDPETGAEVLSALHAHPHIVAATLFDQKGQTFATFVRPNTPSDIPTDASALRSGFGGNRATVFQSVHLAGDRVGTICLQSDTRAITDRVIMHSVVLFSLMGGALTLAAMLSARLQRDISGPILQLVQTVQRVTDEKNYQVRATKSTKDETGLLADGFNEMLAGIEERDVALRASEEEFRTSFELAAVGMVQTDVWTGRYLRVNRKFCEIVGYTAEELLQLKFYEITHPDDHAQNRLYVESVQNEEIGEYTFVKRFIHKNGKTIWCQLDVAAICDAAGSPSHFTVAIQDITERIRFEEELRKLSRSVEQTTDVVYITDREGRIEYVNPAAARLTGYSVEELTGQKLGIFEPGIHDPDTFEHLWQIMLAGESYQGELVNKKKNGDLYYVEVHITPLKDSRGGIANFVTTARDVTERRQLEEQLRQTQKLESIGQLAAGVAHDFNNILTAIMGHASLLRENLASQPVELEMAQEVLNAAERAASLTRQLLIFSRKEVPLSKMLNLNELMQNLAKMLSRIIGEHISLEFKYQQPLPCVEADPGMIEQVIVNLVVNARDAMEHGGNLLVETSVVEVTVAETALHSLTASGPFVCLSVTDNGAGIPAEIRHRIFDPFFTTKDVGKGTGLGLAMVYGVLEQHGGWVDFESTEGQGTTFRFLLPVSAAAVSKERSPTFDDFERGCGQKILLVEDEEAVRNLVQMVLERQGYEISSAESGVEALRIPETELAKIDLLLTDMLMPGGVSGHDLAENLHQRFPQLQVLYCSGYSPESTGLKREMESWASFLQKPFRSRDVLNAVQAAFARRDASLAESAVLVQVKD